MEIALFAAPFLCFALSPALAPLALRCGLSACLRFSPRAAVALSSVASLCACSALLALRGRRMPKARQLSMGLCGLAGGTLGRMALLMFAARFSGSLSLASVQAPALLLFALLGLLPRKTRLPLPAGRVFLPLLALPLAMVEGFFGCGALLLFALFGRGGVQRRANAPVVYATLCTLSAELSALALTHLCGAAQVLPMHLLLPLALGAALGACAFAKTKKRGEVRRGLHTALKVYVLLAALAGVQQAYFS